MLVICPSRGRPQNIADLLDCWAVTEATADLIVCVDVDDPTLEQYDEVMSGQIGLIVGQRQSLTGWINTVAEAECHRHNIIGMIGDDVRPRTKHWDAEIAGAMKRFGVVYGNDLHQSQRQPTHPFLDAELIRRLGFMAPWSIEHLYIDDFWRELGAHLGTLTYLPDVILEHMHPHAGKAEMDDGYRTVNSSDAYRRNGKAFRQYMARHFQRDMVKLT
jgi:hypothetical protein